MKVQILTADQVVLINRAVCLRDNNLHYCNDIGKVQSALHSSYYPGSAPFQHGGIARVGGALCDYICQAHAFTDGNKRTAMLAALNFMALNGVSLQYPKTPKTSALAEVVEACASGLRTIEDMKLWFNNHKC